MYTLLLTIKMESGTKGICCSQMVILTRKTNYKYNMYYNYNINVDINFSGYDEFLE